jgi:hypothetical protein
MAIYHLNAKIISRGKGQSAIAAAAYRSGERLRDEQADETKHYKARAERIAFTDIMAPKDAPEWAHDRNQLWNNAERAEKRKDAQTAREFTIALPHELTEQQREWLVKDFAREAFVRKGYAVDIAIHAPEEGSDERNHHCHLMVPMRTLGPEGFAAMKDRSQNSGAQLDAWRDQWQNIANRHLERHGHAERIDRRTLEAQGIDREATTHLGYAALEMTERGAASDRMAQFREIVERNELRFEIAGHDKEIKALENEYAIQQIDQRAKELANERANARAKKEQEERGRQQAPAPRPSRPIEQIQADHARADLARERQAAQRERAQAEFSEAFEKSNPPLHQINNAPHERATYTPREKPAPTVPEIVQALPQTVRAASQAVKAETRQAVRGVDHGIKAAGRALAPAEKGADALVNFLSGGTEKPKAVFSLDPEERRQQNRAMIEARQAAEQDRRALINMERDLESGRSLRAEDIKHLTPNHRDQLALFGDGAVQKMVEEMRAEERRAQQERERER